MIIPTILEKDFSEIKYKVEIAEKFSKLIQIDFVDGIAARGNPTFLDAKKLGEIKTKAKLELDLMVENPLDFLDEKIPGVIKVCALIEPDYDKSSFINKSRQLGYKVGLSVGPDTNYNQLEDYLDKIDFVQFMTIEPGAQGRKVTPGIITKIQAFKEKYPSTHIQVDGGVSKKTIKGLVEIGVDDFVTGSAIFKSSNPQQNYVELVQMTKNSQKDTISSLKERKIQKIAVLGGAAWEKDDEPYKDAYEIGKVLAEDGYEIVNGGGPGVMRAATQGAHAGGGRVLSITYRPNKPKRHYEGVDPENDFDEEVITLDYFDRTKVMLQTTQLHIVFKGSIGTLSEFGMTWISSWIHEPNNKPILLYGEFWNDYLEVIDKHARITEAEKKILKVCTTPQEVLEYVRSFDE